MRIMGMVACLLAYQLTFAQTVTMSGHVQLENQINHAGIEVVFNRISPAPLEQLSFFTPTSGDFSFSLSPGLYEISMKKAFYFSAFLGQVNCFSNVTLPSRTLKSRKTRIRVPEHFSKIQDAINDSFNGDTVLLERGVYVENIRTKGKAILLTSNFVFTHDPRDIEQTIIDGGGVKSVIVCDFFETNQTVLSGFTVRNGRATGIYPDHFGGGVRCLNTSPTLQHLIIRDNHADYGGGGIFMTASDSKLSHLVILGNSANRDGGGIRVTSSLPTISNCLIARNTAETGGGIAINYFSGLVVTTTVVNSTIAYNHVTRNSMDNVNGGAGIKAIGGNLTLLNSIVAFNTGDYGVSFFDQGLASVPSISYSAFYGNDRNFYQCNPLNGPVATENINGDPADAFLNVFGEVQFTDPDRNDFGLTYGTAAIDAGLNVSVTVMEDLELQPRIHNDNNLPAAYVNMGALEGVSGPAPLLASVAPVCVGESVAVHIQSEGTQFSWYRSLEATNHFAQTTNDVLLDTLTTSNALFIANTTLPRPSKRTKLELNVKPKPDFEIELLEQQETTFTFQASSPAGIEAYAWEVKGKALTSTAASPAFELSSSGEYEVCLLASNPGCEVTSCDTFALVITGISSEQSKESGIYPNPASTILAISSADQVRRIEILDTSGRTVLHREFPNKEVRLEPLSDGLYLIRIYLTSEEVKVYRFQKASGN